MWRAGTRGRAAGDGSLATGTALTGTRVMNSLALGDKPGFWAQAHLVLSLRSSGHQGVTRGKSWVAFPSLRPVSTCKQEQEHLSPRAVGRETGCVCTQAMCVHDQRSPPGLPGEAVRAPHRRAHWLSDPRAALVISQRITGFG